MCEQRLETASAVASFGGAPGASAAYRGPGHVASTRAVADAAAGYAAGVAEEARLADAGAGLVPQSDGWFMLNVSDSAWMQHDVFGARRGLRGRTLLQRDAAARLGTWQTRFRIRV